MHRSGRSESARKRSGEDRRTKIPAHALLFFLKLQWLRTLRGEAHFEAADFRRGKTIPKLFALQTGEEFFVVNPEIEAIASSLEALRRAQGKLRDWRREIRENAAFLAQWR